MSHPMPAFSPHPVAPWNEETLFLPPGETGAPGERAGRLAEEDPTGPSRVGHSARESRATEGRGSMFEGLRAAPDHAGQFHIRCP